jgi:hypothetical protein
VLNLLTKQTQLERLGNHPTCGKIVQSLPHWTRLQTINPNRPGIRLHTAAESGFGINARDTIHEVRTRETGADFDNNFRRTFGFVFNAFSALCNANALTAFFSSFGIPPNIFFRRVASVRTLRITSGLRSIFLLSRARGCASGIHSPAPTYTDRCEWTGC